MLFALWMMLADKHSLFILEARFIVYAIRTDILWNIFYIKKKKI